MWINLTDAEKEIVKQALSRKKTFHLVGGQIEEAKAVTALEDRIKELETPGENDAAYVSAMEARYGSHPWTDGDIDFDDDPMISHGDGGAYVMAWFWVRDEDAGVEEDEGVSCDDCNGTWTEDRIKDGVCDECRLAKGEY